MIKSNSGILGSEILIERATENKFHEYNSDLDTIRMLQEHVQLVIEQNKQLENTIKELELKLSNQTVGGWVIGSGSDVREVCT